MPDGRDTLFRHWTMLRKIPRYPRTISTRQIVDYLTDEGFTVTSRTVERDLVKLSTVFGYSNEEDGRANLWFWPTQTRVLDVPGMDASTALAFNLAQRHLTTLLPPSALGLLSGYFERAGEVLDSAQTNALSAWRDKVRVIGQGPRLQDPATDPKIQNPVYQALLEERRLSLRYKPRGQDKLKTYEFSPLGLVTRHGVTYFVGPFFEYDNVVQIALHRIRSVTLLDMPAHTPEGFDLDAYIESEGEFSYPTGGGRIKLVALFDAGAAHHLHERPLSTDQVTKEKDSGRIQIEATVLETDDLLWWLLGFGEHVEVVRPASLRKALIKTVEKMARVYSPN